MVVQQFRFGDPHISVAMPTPALSQGLAAGSRGSARAPTTRRALGLTFFDITAPVHQEGRSAASDATARLLGFRIEDQDCERSFV